MTSHASSGSPRPCPSHTFEERVALLSQLPYVDPRAIDGRAVRLFPLWDGQQWHAWIAGDRELSRIRVLDTVEGDYVATQPALATDLYLPFIDFMWQRASWPDTCRLISSISDDFHNLGTSAAKLRCFHDNRISLGSRAVRFAVTELEYVLVLARGIFDLLQEVVAKFWNTKVRLHDPAYEALRRRTPVPESFSKLVLRDKRSIRTAEEIVERFHLPLPLASEYSRLGEFFSSLRDARDLIVHSGRTLGVVYSTERGFCVVASDRPFSTFTQWSPIHRYNENLVSVLPWLSWVVVGTINACTTLTTALASTVAFPSPLAPTHKVFVRGPSNEALVHVWEIANGGSPWWDQA